MASMRVLSLGGCASAGFIGFLVFEGSAFLRVSDRGASRTLKPAPQAKIPSDVFRAASDTASRFRFKAYDFGAVAEMIHPTSALCWSQIQRASKAG